MKQIENIHLRTRKGLISWKISRNGRNKYNRNDSTMMKGKHQVTLTLSR